MTGVWHRTTKEILRLPFPSQSHDKPWLWPNKKRTDQTLKSGNSSKAIKLCIEAIMHNYRKKLPLHCVAKSYARNQLQCCSQGLGWQYTSCS